MKAILCLWTIVLKTEILSWIVEGIKSKRESLWINNKILKKDKKVIIRNLSIFTYSRQNKTMIQSHEETTHHVCVCVWDRWNMCKYFKIFKISNLTRKNKQTLPISKWYIVFSFYHDIFIVASIIRYFDLYSEKNWSAASARNQDKQASILTCWKVGPHVSVLGLMKATKR